MPSSLDESSITATHRLGDSFLIGDCARSELLSRYPCSDARLSKMGRSFAHRNELQFSECGDLGGAELFDLVRQGRVWLQLLRIDAKRDGLALLTRNLGQEAAECLKANVDVQTVTFEISSS